MKLLFSFLLTLLALLPLTTADKLDDAINAAAKSAAAKKQPPAQSGQKKPGAQPSPTKPSIPNLGGLGIVGGFGVLQPAPNYGAKCKNKNGRMAQAIQKLCSKPGGLMVPSDYMSKGWCIDGNQEGTVQWESLGDGTTRRWGVRRSSVR